MPISSEHPARKLGAWLRARRRDRSIVARVLASELDLTPAEYSEIEVGVVRRLTRDVEKRMVQVLGLTQMEVDEFAQLLAEARGTEPLEFDDIFSRQDLTPMRLRRKTGRQATERDINKIVDAVFKPLP